MKKIQLGIPQPCHENWNKMKPEEKGRFCNSCQKTVMDFREMSDRQLAEFFKRPVGSVCGRFNTDQLNRDIPIPRKHIPWVKYFFQFSFPAFLFSMKASAQGRVVVQDKIFVQEKTGFNPEGHGIKSKENNNDSIPKTNRIILKGKITDESGRAIKEASIIIIGTNIGVATDENGMYQLPCKTGDRLAIMGFGFVAIETIVNSAEMNFTVKENVCKLKEVIVTEPMGMVAYRPDFKESKRKDVGRTISKFVDSTKKLLKIFPNPVLSNNLIKIDVSQLKKGNYQVNLFKGDGSLIRSRTYNHLKENKWIEERSNGLPAGSYYFNFINIQTGKIFTEKIIVQ